MPLIKRVVEVMHMLIIQLIKLLQCEKDEKIQKDTQRGNMQSERTSDSLNEGLPIKNRQIKVSKKTIVFP